MIPIRCPKCGAASNVPDGLGGRSVRCPKCGAVVAVRPVVSKVFQPAPIVEPLDDGNQFATDDEPDEPRRPKRIPPEPWYYRWIQVLIFVCTALGLTYVAIRFLMGFTIAMKADSGSLIWASVVALVGGILIALTWAAFMLLSLDVARNVRLVRFNTRP